MLNITRGLVADIEQVPKKLFEICSSQPQWTTSAYLSLTSGGASQ